MYVIGTCFVTVTLVEIAIEWVRILALATKMDIGRPPALSVPQQSNRT